MRNLPAGSRWIRAELRFALHGQLTPDKEPPQSLFPAKASQQRDAGMKLTLDLLAGSGANSSPVGHWQRGAAGSVAAEPWAKAERAGCALVAVARLPGGPGSSQHLPTLQFP